MNMHNALFFLLLLCLSTACLAADNVEVRFGKNDGYERLVFEWPQTAPTYKVEQTESGVQLDFGAAVNLDTAKIQGADSAFIKEFQIKTPQQIFIFLNPHDEIRDMKLGKKVVVDIYGDPEKAKQAPPAKPEEEEPEAGQKPPEEKVEKAADDKADAKPEEHGEKSDQTPPPQTILGKAVKSTDETDPYAFVLSSTDGVKMAAYKRFGDLWVLINKVDLPIEPHIEGENKNKFGKIDKMLVADNTATLWRIDLPEDFNIMGEGGSLYWRLIMSPGYRDNPIKPTLPQKEEVLSDALRSGKVMFPIAAEHGLVTFTDPVAGDKIQAVVMDTSEVYTDKYYEFVDFDVLSSPIGLAFLQKNPDLKIDVKSDSVTLSTDNGLALTKPADISKSAKIDELPSPIANNTPSNRIFNFREWQMGPESALEENQRLIFGSMRGKSTNGQAERMLVAGKLNLAHARGVEAKGLVENARALMPGLSRSPELIALRGAASYIAGQYDLAIQDLANKELSRYPELAMWKAATLAHLGDWQQAIETLPRDFSALDAYPPRIANPLILTLSEIALRDGNKEAGKSLLSRLEKDGAELSEPQKNGVRYLEGEIARQNGNIEDATAIWTKLSKQEDPLYRTKAELALVALGREKKTLNDKDAINRLENLRFVWRGDDLEIQVLRQLGISEIEAAKYLDGFKTLRDTVVLSANNQLSDNVTALMMKTYEDLFLTDKLETVSPLDAAMLYEEFRELTPSGDKGDKLVARLAERLVDADLLARAVKLLAYQLDYRLSGEEAISTALRMASIQLMDRRAEDALMTLSKAETLLKRTDFPGKALKQTDLNLLRARALSDTGDVSGAMNLLENIIPPSKAIHRLEADIAWKAGSWNEAAEALRQLVLTSDFDSSSTLTAEEAQLLLNYAISLNLSDQRMTLSNIRERHLDQMQQTDKGQAFEVITRPRQNALLADRDTIMGMINETEIFSEFLDSYKTQN